MKDLEKTIREGEEFLETGYKDLPDLAKMNVNTYMRGVKDGLAMAAKTEKETGELVAV